MGSAQGPEPARPLEPGGDPRFTAGLDDTGADEQTLRPEVRIPHPWGVGFQVVRSLVGW